jgi:hypothetical protein
MSDASIIGHLAQSIKVETVNKQLRRGPDLAWAERIVAKQARGEKVSYYAGKLAAQALLERDMRIAAHNGTVG